MAIYNIEEFHQGWARAFNAGDKPEMLALYEEEAAFVVQPGKVVTGKEIIGQVLDGFLALKGKMDLKPEAVVIGEGVALLISFWQLEGFDPEGKPLKLAGRTADVVRQQPDGSWLAAIDNPTGGQAA